MRFQGPLGLTRFTNLGPFVSISNEKKRYVSVIVETADDLDINLEDMDEEETKEFHKQLARNYYSGDSELMRAKQRRLEMCLNEKWSNNWIDGMEEGLGFDFSELERTAQRLSACRNLTENATSDDPEQLPP